MSPETGSSSVENNAAPDSPLAESSTSGGDYVEHQDLMSNPMNSPMAFNTYAPQAEAPQPESVPDSNQEVQTAQVNQEVQTAQTNQEVQEATPDTQYEGLTPEESAVASKAEQLKPGWGERASREIVRVADRLGFYKILEGVQKGLEGLKERRTVKMALKLLKSEARNARKEAKQMFDEGPEDFYGINGGDIRGMERVQDTYSSKTAGIQELKDVGHKGLIKTRDNSLTALVAGEDIAQVPLRPAEKFNPKDKGWFNANDALERVQLGYGEGPSDSVLKFLGRMQESLSEIVDGHNEDMERITTRKTQITQVRQAVESN